MKLMKRIPSGHKLERLLALMRRSRSLSLFGLVVSSSLINGWGAASVQVTVKLDAARIGPGETTTLHVFAQIVQAQRATSDQIFSWYVDLQNSSGSVAKLIPENLVRPASDRDPRTSSSGSTDGADLRGIYDTFLSLANAGRDTAVELFSIPVQGVASGKATLRVEAGTTVSGLGEDFIVAPIGGGSPLVGGDYSAAAIDLEVTGAGSPALAITATPQASGQGVKVTLTFAPVAGRNHFVEFTDSLGPSGVWQQLPGAPHNSGVVTDLTTSGQRFYRLRLATP